MRIAKKHRGNDPEMNIKRIIKSRTYHLVKEKEYLRTYFNIRSRSVKLNYKPQVINIELTNDCGLDCLSCPRRQIQRKVGYMESKVFKEEIKQVKTYSISNFVWLHHFGDPILHEDFDRFSIIADKMGIKTGISTKGNSLNERKRKKLINSKISKVVFSWAGTGKKDFEKKQRGIDYEKTMENIKKYLREKPKDQKAIIQLLLYSKKNKKMESFRNKWEKIADKVEFKECHRWIGDEKKINKVIKFEKNGLNPCPDIWREVAILYNGDVVPCCRDYDGKYILGNVKESNLFEIWNNEKMTELRSFHLKSERKKVELCSNCKNSITLPIKRVIQKIKDFRNIHLHFQ